MYEGQTSVDCKFFGCHCFILTTHMSRVLILAEIGVCIPLKCICSNAHGSVHVKCMFYLEKGHLVF